MPCENFAADGQGLECGHIFICKEADITDLKCFFFNWLSGLRTHQEAMLMLQVSKRFSTVAICDLNINSYFCYDMLFYFRSNDNSITITRENIIS